MTAYVFHHSQIEPALQRWFGSQRFHQTDEAAFQARLQAFLSSPEASDLRLPEPTPEPPQAAAEAAMTLRVT